MFSRRSLQATQSVPGAPSLGRVFLQTGAFAYGPGTPTPTAQQAADSALAFDLMMVKSDKWKTYVPSMKVANPRLNMWGYFNGAMDANNTSAPLVCTSPTSVLYTLDSSSFNLTVEDVESTWWHNQKISDAQTAKDNNMDGAFNDNFGPALFSANYLVPAPYQGSTVNSGWDSTPVAAGYSWESWRDVALKTVVDAERAGVSGIDIVANAFSSGSSWFGSQSSEPELSYLDGGLAEIWMRSARGDAPGYYRSETQWKQDVDMLVDALATHPTKKLIVSCKHWSSPSPTTAESLQLERYALASYLLGAGDTAGNNNAYFCYNNAYNDNTNQAGLMDPTDFPYKYDWYIDPGIPSEAYSKVGSVYKRRFTKGLVVVNPTSSDTTYTVSGGPYITMPSTDGGAWPTVPNGNLTVLAHTGVVLLK